jgi:hypothetical protein
MTRIFNRMFGRRDEGDRLMQFVWVLGVVMTAFGTAITGEPRWTLVGVALIVFSTLFE